MRGMRLARRAVRRRGGTAPRINPDPVTSYGGAVQGLWTGGNESDGVIASVKMSVASSLVRLVASTSADLSNPYYSSESVATSSATNSGGTTYHLAKPKITGLPSNTQFYYGVLVNGILQGASVSRGEFKTTPPAGTAASFRFAFSSCDNSHTHNTYATMSALNPKPLFFHNTGDIGYFDIATNSPGLFHTGFDGILASSGAGPFYRTMPSRYMWSDHDFGFDNQKGTSTPARPAALSVYRQRVPHPPLGLPNSDDPICYEYTVGRVCFLVLDTRTDSTAGNTVENDPAQTRLGAEQKAWFKARLIAPENAGKVFVITFDVPWVATGAGGASDTDTWSGFRNERREIADYLKANGFAGRVCIMHGDMHALGYVTGSPTDYATGGGMVIPCMAAAPLNENGSIKGGPWDQTYNLGAEVNANLFGYVDVTDSGGSSITFDFRGMDVGGTQRISATFSLSTVAVAPVITAGQTFSVGEAATIGTTVGTVATTGGAPASWSITGGNTGTAFALSTAGVITVAAALSNATTPSYSLTVSATNSGGTDTETLTVNVTAASVTPVAFVQAAAAPENTLERTSATIALTSPATAGNLLLVYASPDKAVASIPAPTGFTLVPGMQHLTGPGVSAALFYKVAAGGEQNITCTHGGSNTILFSAAAVELSGASTSSPIDLSVMNTGNTLPGTTPRTLALTTGASTTSGAGQMAVACWSNDSMLNISAATAVGWDNGFTQRADSGVTTRNGSNGSPALSVATLPITNAGTAVSTTFSYTGGGDDERMGILVTVRKA